MKKVSRKIFGLLAASMIFAGAGAFVSCSNGSDSPSTSVSNPNESTGPLTDSATVSEVASVTTSGNASVTGSVATLSASNGTYVLTGSSGTSGNISASGNPTPTTSGTWKFTETGDTIAKYVGSYTGSIETIGFSATSLTLKVEKYLINGSLAAVVEEKTFDISFTSTSTEFNATIPAIKVSNVISYLLTQIDAQYMNAQNYRIKAKIERIDASPNGNCALSSVRSLKLLNNGAPENSDDNTTLNAQGTYAIADGKLTGTFFGKTRTLTVDDDGNLYGADNGEPLKYELISGSYKIYANAMTALDGENSYARIRTIWLNEDAGKIGLIVDLKKTMASKDKPMIFVNYTINENTITFTGVGADAGYSKTATLSADGKTLTLDGVDYIKL